jgi:hypothetical protein
MSCLSFARVCVTLSASDTHLLPAATCSRVPVAFVSCAVHHRVYLARAADVLCGLSWLVLVAVSMRVASSGCHHSVVGCYALLMPSLAVVLPTPGRSGAWLLCTRGVPFPSCCIRRGPPVFACNPGMLSCVCFMLLPNHSVSADSMRVSRTSWAVLHWISAGCLMFAVCPCKDSVNADSLPLLLPE